MYGEEVYAPKGEACGCEGRECRFTNCAATAARWSVASTLFKDVPTKYGCGIDSDEPVEMVDGLCVLSTTESLRIEGGGGVGGVLGC